MMMPGLIKEEHAQDLQRALERFYRTTTDYSAFIEPSHHPDRWALVVAEIASVVVRKGHCRVLEIGAGRSGFGKHFQSPNVFYAVQDVTPVNAEYLERRADEIHVGDLETVPGCFDVIFSTFVFEHVSHPRKTLERCWEMLAPGGTLLVFCPRYDIPGYLPPSVDHLHLLHRVGLMMYVLLRRGLTWITGWPAFLLVADPSVLHRAWTRDRDAIHLASAVDLGAWAYPRGRVTRHRIPSTSFKDWVVKNLLQINLSIHKPGPER